MDAFTHKLKLIFGDATLRSRILFVIGGLVLFRLLATIPTPGVDTVRLQEFFTNNQFLGLLNIFSGGGLSNLSIVMLGVGPYITASIIMQLLTVMSPRLKALYTEEGETGRQKFTQISRLITLPLAILQAFSFLALLQNQGILAQLSLIGFVTNIIVVVAGSMLLMWIGELITEFGIGNGTSLIIFAGIVASIPSTASQALFTFDPSQLPLYLVFAVVAAIIIYSVVVITEAERPVPVTYAKRVRGNKVYGGVSTYLPLRLNQAGVIPIIFALSILLFPQMLLNILSNLQMAWVSTASAYVLTLYQNQWFYAGVYFVLVFLFTYFYTAVTFDPDSISKNLQRNGAFVPGVRPGVHTSEYLAKVITRLTLVGASFLGIIAVMPYIITNLTGFQTLAIGGTALLIVVSVVLDIIRRIDSQISLREY